MDLRGLLLTGALGLAFIPGILIIRLSGRRIIEQISISLAAGAMIALAVFDLMPEILENYRDSGYLLAGAFVLLGILILAGLDKFVPAHEAHDSHNHESMAHIGIMSAIAITLHNILEGMTVYSIAARDISAGISLGVGVGLHNIPMGMLIYATLRKEKGIKKYGFMGLAIVSTFLGGLIMAGLSSLLSPSVLNFFVCITLGMVIFIVAFELLPSFVKEEKKLPSLLCVLLGFLLVLMG